MGKFKILNIEKISKNKERLLKLEKENKYVFHGSLEKLNFLKPIQAFNYNNKKEKMEKDGFPAVCATPCAEIAIFRSLINKKDVKAPSESSFGIKNNQLFFKATENLLKAAKNKKGIVYVLNKSDFEKFTGIEYRSNKINKPIEVIDVSFKDLPENIKIIKLIE